MATHFSSILLPLDESIVLVDQQYRTESGQTDIVVIGDRTHADGTNERVVYVWELKAPQIWVFSKETESRVRPSDGLYSAENQLLHYHSFLAGSDTFCTRWSVARRNVKIGGIIIGTEATFIRCGPTERIRMTGIARTALDVREDMFYRGCGLAIRTWNWVLKAVPLLTASHRRISVTE